MSGAAIYTRISEDDTREAKGVGRQEEDCRELADRLGLPVVAVFSDNDLGASTRSKKPRPAYDELIARARAGEFTALIAYTSSRLTRRPRESEDIIELVEQKGLRLHTVRSGSFDLTTADGRAVARTLAAWDAAEAERTAERVARAALQRAQEGRTHGRVPFGWRRIDGVEVLDAEGAAVVSEAVRRKLDGESLRAIMLDLNRRGIASPNGGEWSSAQLKQVLVRERNCGRRVYRGEVIGPGNWPAIVTEEQHDQVVAMLTDPSRRKQRGTELRHLLSGLILCGRCGARCGSAAGITRKRVDGTKVRGGKTYTCTTCFKVRAKIEDVDRVVEGLVEGRLAMPDAPLLFAGDPEAVRAAQEERDGLRARMDRAADDYADAKITADQLARITARLRPRLAEAEAKVRASGPPPSLGVFDGRVPPLEAWKGAPVALRREVVNVLVELTLKPTGSGHPFTPERVGYRWKGATA